MMSRLEDLLWSHNHFALILFVIANRIFVNGIRPDPDTELDLNKWLIDFQNCYINIMVLEPDLYLTPFSYPITIYSATAGNDPIMHPKLRNRVFCSSQIFALSKLETLQNSILITSAFGKYYDGDMPPCSVPASRNPDELLWTYSHSHCTIIIAGLQKQRWDIYKEITPYADNVMHILYNVHFDLRCNEYFLLFIENMAAESESNLSYLCRFCGYYFNISEFPIPCKNGVGCRNGIESVVHEVTQDGRSIVPRFPVESFYDTEEENRSFLFTTSPLKTMDILRNITTRSYWKNSRIPFTKLIQGILFETVPGYNATELIESMSKYSELMKILIDLHVIQYKVYGKLRVPTDHSTLYVTGSSSFNFVTCHGLQEDSSVKAYLGPFDVGTWSMVILILVATPVTLVITLFLCIDKRTHRIYQQSASKNFKCVFLRRFDGPRKWEFKLPSTNSIRGWNNYKVCFLYSFSHYGHPWKFL